MTAESLRLHDFQATGVQWLQGHPRGLLADACGCIAGDAIVQIDRAHKVFSMPIKDLFQTWHDGTPTYIKALCGRELRFHRIQRIVYSGIKETVRLTLKSGKTLQLTPDHEICVAPKEFVPVADLRVGSPILTDGWVQSAPVLDAVASITFTGDTETFDIVCEDPWRNFVVNGIIVHNCGKTPQALMALHEMDRVLVVTTKSTQLNWAREAARWRPDLGTACVDRRSFRLPHRNEVVVTRWSSLPEAREFTGTLILDEVHKIRNPATQMAKRARALAAKAERVWGLSGTPIITRPEDAFWILDGIGLGPAIGGYSQFQSNVKRDWNGIAWGIYPGFKEEVEQWVLRRTKAEVMPYLPEKRYGLMLIPITDANLLWELDRVLRELGGKGELAAILDGVRGKMAAKQAKDCLATTRSLLAMAKLPTALQWITLKEALGQPVIVTSVHRVPIEVLGERLGWATITGSTSAAKRQAIIDHFQDGGFKGLGMTAAGGEGITLTRAAEMFRIDLDWSPALNLQMEDRIHRAGQHNEVFIMDARAEHEIDEIVCRSIARKAQIMQDAGFLA